MSDGFQGFSEAAFDFFRELREHNTRSWFEAHRTTYQEKVLDPAIAFVEELGPRLEELDSMVRWDSRPHGRGSIFRIHRDVRFSKDKSPYKTYLGVLFWRGERPAKKENPGFYFGLSPEGAGIHGGLWGFPSDRLDAYRQAVDSKAGEQLADLLLPLRDPGFDVWGQQTERVPRGYPADHPRADLLRYKGLHASTGDLPREVVTSRQLLDSCFAACRTLLPLVRWLGNHVTAG